MALWSATSVSHFRQVAETPPCTFFSSMFFVHYYTLPPLPPLHGDIIHCHITYSHILATYWSSSLVEKCPWLLLQSSRLLGNVPVIHGAVLITSSTPDFSSSWLFLSASPSQQKASPEGGKVDSQAKDEGCGAAPYSSLDRPANQSSMHKK